MLEAGLFEDNAFLTLTYDDSSLPIALSGFPTLAPEHTKNWLKRLRKAIAPTRLRFFLAGEYGETTWRPHYHAAIFGLPTCSRGRTRRLPGSARPVWKGCCASCELVGNTWGHGDVDLGILETSSAQYVAGYVTKKMMHRLDPRLRGREPEFSRKSNRPGLAYHALHEIASVLMKFDLDTTQGDVPVTLRHGSRELPLGRYLRQNLRRMIGKSEKCPDQVLQAIAAEMLPLREDQLSRPGRVSLASVIEEANKQAVRNFRSRRSLYNSQRNSL